LCLQEEKTLSVTEGGSGGSMSVDASGNLYVADYWNHRVLKYNSPFATDGVADEIWGQDSYTLNTCNKGRGAPDATTLCFSWGNSNNLTAGVDLDAAGNLWIADSGNNRVLRFPPGSHTADLVLGQPDFFSKAQGTDLTRFRGPSAVRVSQSGRIFVSDQGNSRVLVFDPSPQNGAAGATFGSGFYGPTGVDMDPNGGVWVSNSFHNTVERWDEGTQTLIEVLGARGNGNILGGASGSIGIDSAGNKYVTVQAGELQNDVVMFAPGRPTNYPSRQLFGPTRGGNAHDASGIATGAGVAVADNQLIVADQGRLLFWNDPSSLANGKPADGFTGGASSFADYSRYGCCVTLKADRSHHLWVSMSYNGSIQHRIEVFQLPLTTSQSPFAWITYPLPVLGGGTLTNNGRATVFWGLAPSDDGKFLWISQSDGNRVFRVRDPLTTNPVVDVILGQTDPNGVLCNRGGPPRSGATPDSLCLPGALALDRKGNLYVSDHSLEIQGNMRLLEFNKELFPENTDRVIYAPAASKIFPNVATWEPAFDAQNRMVVGYNPYWPGPGDGGRFPGIYNDPLGPSTTPDAFLNDYYSMAFSATFDDAGNLYVGDLDRARVLVYKDPFGPGGPSSPPASPPPGYTGPPSGSVPGNARWPSRSVIPD
jgi:sugar lactone lactonase YvrE